MSELITLRSYARTRRPGQTLREFGLRRIQEVFKYVVRSSGELRIEDLLKEQMMYSCREQLGAPMGSFCI